MDQIKNLLKIGIILTLVTFLLIPSAVPAQLGYSLTCSANPRTVCPGSTVTITGRLTDASTGQGVPGAPVCVDIRKPNGQVDGICMSTNSNGGYSRSFSDTREQGSYSVTAKAEQHGATASSSFTVVSDPNVHIASETYYGMVNQEIEFTASAYGGKSPYSWYWTFGDGNSASKQSPEHTYSEIGTYNVQLKLTDACGKTAFDTSQAIITDELIANANGPYMGTVIEAVDFEGSATGGIPPYIWHWDFGDGTESDLQNPEHLYESIGEYTVKLTITDDAENIAEDTTTANIIENNPPETPSITGTTSGRNGVEYEYTFVTTDPDGDYVYYWIQWGGSCPYIEWIGPYPSGQEIVLNNSWPDQGDYTITAKAKDTNKAESDWGTYYVSMPRSRLFSFQTLINLINWLKSFLSLT